MRKFYTLNYIGNMQIPRGKWGTAEQLEPITADYPEFGTGVAIQVLIVNKTVTLIGMHHFI